MGEAINAFQYVVRAVFEYFVDLGARHGPGDAHAHAMRRELHRTA